MCSARPMLTLHPESCDGCGRCVEQCPKLAVKVGAGYIYVDWDRCDGCGKCVAYCDRDAIEERSENQVAEASASLAGSPGERAARAPSAWRRALDARVAQASADGDVTDRSSCWTALDAWAVVGASVLLVVALQLALNSEMVRTLTSSGIMLARAALLGAYYVIQLALLIGLAVFRHDMGFAEAFSLDRAPRLRAVVATLALLVGTWLFSMIYRVSALSSGWKPPAADARGITALFGSDAIGMSLTVLVVVFVGPVVEELALRGVVLPVLAARIPVWGAIAASSVLFAVLHASAWSMLPLTVLGLALGWVATRYDSLWPAIGLHVGYNGVLVAAALLASRG